MELLIGFVVLVILMACVIGPAAIILGLRAGAKNAKKSHPAGQDRKSAPTP